MAGKSAVGDVADETLGPPEPLSPFVALRHYDFRLILGGRFVSTIGRQMQIVAISFQVYEIHHSALELGLLGLFRVLPVILFSLAGGVLADQVDRRNLMLMTQPVMLCSSAALAALTFAGLAHLAAIYGITVISAAAGSLNQPAQQAIIPGLVPREHLPNALSWNITLSQVAMIAGPALGGVALASIGIGGTYFCDAAGFLAVIISLLLMRSRLGPAATHGPRGWRAAVEGLQFIRHNPIVLAVMSLDFGATFWGSATVLLPIFAVQILHVGAEGLGILYSAPAAGSVVGAAAMTAFANRVRFPGWPLLIAVVGYGVATAGFGLSRVLWISLLCLAGTGLFDTISMTLRHQILQLLTPDEVRGRVTAANQMFVQGGPQLGQLEAGAVADAISTPFSVVSGGVACILTVILIAWLVPAIRRYKMF